MPIWKRGLDIVAAVFLLIFLSPLFFFVACMIKTVSPGPAFFKQLRVGYGGKIFILYKFRSMKVDADTSSHQKYLTEVIKDPGGENGTGKPMIKLDDPQTIPFFGKMMRISCIDELPQLINVFRGEMSLVGPRPAIPYEVKKYLGWHTGRLDEIPGMPGLWQVSGKNRLTFKDMARLDILYSRKLSFALDLKILLSTPRAIFNQMKDKLREQQALVKQGGGY